MTHTRDEIELDLAFAVNGTLSDEDHAEIERWLVEDELLRAEHDALAVIRAEMQAEEVNSPGEFGLARLLRDVGREGAALAALPAPSRTWMWQLAAAVAVVALLAQALFQRTPDAGGYQLAGVASSADMVVSFAPDATETQIRNLLVGLEIEIVAGPSALGFYQLDVLEGADQAAAFDGLQSANGIIESVENAHN